MSEMKPAKGLVRLEDLKGKLPANPEQAKKLMEAKKETFKKRLKQLFYRK